MFSEKINKLVLGSQNKASSPDENRLIHVRNPSNLRDEETNSFQSQRHDSQDTDRPRKGGQREVPSFMSGGPAHPYGFDNYYFKPTVTENGFQWNGDNLPAGVQISTPTGKSFYDRPFCDGGEQRNGRFYRQDER